MLMIKVSVGEDLRRFSADISTITFNDIRNKISTLFGIKHQNFTLQYEDDEKDKILLTSEAELQEALLISGPSNVLRIFVNVYTPGQPLNPNAENINSSLSTIMRSVPQEQMTNLITSVLTSPVMQQMFVQVLNTTLTSIPMQQIQQQLKQTQTSQSSSTSSPLPSPSNDSKKEENVNSNSQVNKNTQKTEKKKSDKKKNEDPSDEGPVALYVNDVDLFDGSVVSLGSQVTKTWCLLNCGKEAWPKGTKLVWEGGDKFGMCVESDEISVEAGKEVNVQVTVTVPDVAGRYTSYWRLRQESVGKFGPRLWIDVIVKKKEDNIPPTETVKSDMHVNESLVEAVTSVDQQKEEEKKIIENEPIVNNDCNDKPVGDNASSEYSNIFENGLSQLVDMGFSDRETNIKMMVQYNCDVLQVVQALLNKELMSKMQ